MVGRRRQRELIERTSIEHGSIDRCVVDFESALATPEPAAEAGWHARLLVHLSPLIDCLDEHRTSAEAPGGLLSEIEVALGRSHEVSTARRLHRSAASRASELFEALQGTGAAAGRDDFGTDGRRLASAIRRHHELEADLILMAFDQDIGTVD